MKLRSASSFDVVMSYIVNFRRRTPLSETFIIRLTSSCFSNLANVVSPAAVSVACAMALGAWASVATKQVEFSDVPTIPLFLICIAFGFDGVLRFMSHSRIAAMCCASTYAILYLACASFAGILFAYATQRFGMPLEDDFFTQLDRSIGIDWIAVTHWVDRHPLLAQALRASYKTMSAQIVLGAVGLSLLHDHRGMRAYLLAYSLALAATASVAALLPGLSPAAILDRSSYHQLSFSGASPLDHLAALRSAGTAQIHGDIGGILTFPSFHATVAVLTPLVLRRSWLALAILVPLDVMMLCATVTEGAHYACDAVAGGVLACAALAVATRFEALKPGLGKHLP